LEVDPVQGLLLLHWTGHDFLHSGERVLAGEKWLLRTDVYYSRVRRRSGGGMVVGGGGEEEEEEKAQQRRGGGNGSKRKKGGGKKR